MANTITASDAQVLFDRLLPMAKVELPKEISKALLEIAVDSEPEGYEGFRGRGYQAIKSLMTLLPDDHRATVIKQVRDFERQANTALFGSWQGLTLALMRTVNHFIQASGYKPETSNVENAFDFLGAQLYYPGFSSLFTPFTNNASRYLARLQAFLSLDGDRLQMSEAACVRLLPELLALSTCRSLGTRLWELPRLTSLLTQVSQLWSDKFGRNYLGELTDQFTPLTYDYRTIPNLGAGLVHSCMATEDEWHRAVVSHPPDLEWCLMSPYEVFVLLERHWPEVQGVLVAYVAGLFSEKGLELANFQNVLQPCQVAASLDDINESTEESLSSRQTPEGQNAIKGEKKPPKRLEGRSQYIYAEDSPDHPHGVMRGTLKALSIIVPPKGRLPNAPQSEIRMKKYAKETFGNGTPKIWIVGFEGSKIHEVWFADEGELTQCERYNEDSGNGSVSFERKWKHA